MPTHSTPRPAVVAVLVALAALVTAGCTHGFPQRHAPPDRIASALNPSPDATASSRADEIAPSPSGSAPAGAVAYVFPVHGGSSYAHTHHDYPATDIMAACGTPVVAATDGVVLTVSRIDTYDPKVNAGATRGGLAVSILGDDGVRYYGSHLAAIDPAIRADARVSAGQPLGKVGRTGDASACHLHFGISPPCGRTTDWWIQRGVVWPWPYLDSWRNGGGKSAVAEVDAWRSANGCPSAARTDP
jgi:murein DD-endopeptidase MepM/ murein hydrolase activator NlpD